MLKFISKTKPDKPLLKMAFLIVNGKFNYNNELWIRLCIDRLIKYTSPFYSYKIFVWNHDCENDLVNNYLNELKDIIEVRDEKNFDLRKYHGPKLDKIKTPPFGSTFADGYNIHRTPLQILYNEAVKKYNVDIFFTLDSDAWPIAYFWDVPLIYLLDEKVKLAGVWRNELYPYRIRYIHPSGLGIKHSIIKQLNIRFDHRPDRDDQDSLSNFTVEVEKKFGHDAVYPLVRTNKKQYHHIFGGIYGNLIYHHHLGSRYKEGNIKKVMTKGSIERGESPEQNRIILDALTHLIFSETDGTILSMAYGDMAFDLKKYYYYLQNGDKIRYEIVRKEATELAQVDPIKAFLILGFTLKHFVKDFDLLKLYGELALKTGNVIMGESILNVVQRLKNGRGL